jgi:hypothetical protein
MKHLMIILITVSLIGCTDVPLTSSNPGLYSLPEGSILKLNQALTIPARKARTGIQYGKPTRGVDKWHPYCEVVVNTLSDSQATIVPGNYRVTKIRRAQIPYAGTQPDGGNLLASTSAAGLTIAQSPSYAWLYKTTVSLESTDYPDIRQIECGAVFGTGYDARHMTVREFEETVGKVITLVQATGTK